MIRLARILAVIVVGAAAMAAFMLSVGLNPYFDTGVW